MRARALVTPCVSLGSNARPDKMIIQQIKTRFQIVNFGNLKFT